MSQWQSLADLAQNPAQEFHKVQVNAEESGQFFPGFEPLDNEVHDLWRCAAWRNYKWSRYIESYIYDTPAMDVSVEFWCRAKPALQLATKLLERAAPIFVRILRAPIVRLASGKRGYDKHWVPSSEDYTSLDIHLKSLAAHYRIFIMEPQPAGSSMKAGVSAVCMDRPLPERTYHHPRAMTGIAAEILDEIHDARWLTKSPINKCSVLIILGNLLVHELAHALYRKREVIESFDLPRDAGWRAFSQSEPVVFPHDFCELGYVVENFIWGTTFQVKWGLYLTRWDRENGLTRPAQRPLFDGTGGVRLVFLNERKDKNPYLHRVMNNRTMFSLFNKEFWTKEKLILHYHDEYMLAFYSAPGMDRPLLPGLIYRHLPPAIQQQLPTDLPLLETNQPLMLWGQPLPTFQPPLPKFQPPLPTVQPPLPTVQLPLPTFQPPVQPPLPTVQPPLPTAATGVNAIEIRNPRLH